MAFITEEQSRELEIDRFIFHVVHHGEEEPILLDETPIGQFHNFFVGRVREVLKGNRFEFLEQSTTQEAIRNVSEDIQNFREVSQNLAVDFHRFGDDRIKPGVLIFMVLSAGEEKLYSLIKYDHEEVLTYKVENDRKAVLESVTNSLTKSTKSLHKSALVRLDDDQAGQILVVDRKVSHDISDFFKGFLTARRKYNPTEMTEEIQNLTIRTVQDHKNDLPNALTSKIRQKSYDTIIQTDHFDSDQYFDLVFGAHGNDEIRETFNKYLEKNDLDGEVFEFDNEAVNMPGKKKYRTREGVKLEYPESAYDKVDIERGFNDNEETKITIITQKLSEL